MHVGVSTHVYAYFAKHLCLCVCTGRGAIINAGMAPTMPASHASAHARRSTRTAPTPQIPCHGLPCGPSRRPGPVPTPAHAPRPRPRPCPHPFTRLRREDAYVSWLAKALIATGRAPAAWELYAAHEASGAAEDRGALLRLIANDAYKMGQFAVALRVGRARGCAREFGAAWYCHLGRAGVCAGRGTSGGLLLGTGLRASLWAAGPSTRRAPHQATPGAQGLGAHLLPLAPRAILSLCGAYVPATNPALLCSCQARLYSRHS